MINFLTDLSLVADIDEAQIDSGVTLMTMHSAKGLEFPIVFLMGMEESLFPHIRAIKSDDEHEMEEERRICYVAITRRRSVIYYTCNFSYVIWTFTSKSTITLLKRNSEELLETPAKSKRQTITSKSTTSSKRGFSKRTTSTKTSICFRLEGRR